MLCCVPVVHYGTANLRTNIMDFRGFDSSIILSFRAGIPRPIGNSPESLSQAILAGIMLVGELGVCRVRVFYSGLHIRTPPPPREAYDL